MKVDVLALGMLSCLKRGFDLLEREKRVYLPDIASVPAEAPEVYAMLSRADSVGVFQVESRAQMSMLPRLKPQTFYDLVIEVAIVRPGPIQGDMVHPYLRRREGKDPVEFPAPSPEHGPPDELEQVLGKTLGVPLFQEQAMRLAIEAAKFTAAEADGLRRAMATFKSQGNLAVYAGKFVEGMVARGYDREFAERCFRQIEGFGSYGFPESHAASFANLVYASAWVKCFHPDVFCAAILNSQPMGFYQPAQLVRDAREHGVEVRGTDLLHSDWDCGLEEPVEATGGLLAVRLGFRVIGGLRRADAETLVAARAAGARTPEAFARAGVPLAALERLADADAFRSLGLDRRRALWAVRGLEPSGPETSPLVDRMGPVAETQPLLPLMGLSEHVAEDYRTTGLSLKAHPCSFFRKALAARGAVPAEVFRGLKNGRRVTVAGLVLIRQRPGTAQGVTFLTLEDETGIANVVIWRDRFEANRRTVMTSSFLQVSGVLQKEGEVIHLVAEAFVDLSPHLSKLRDAPEPRRERGGSRLQRSRDFH
jgi:error-prone DNA polymerase